MANNNRKYNNIIGKKLINNTIEVNNELQNSINFMLYILKRIIINNKHGLYTNLESDIEDLKHSVKRIEKFWIENKEK